MLLIYFLILHQHYELHSKYIFSSMMLDYIAFEIVFWLFAYIRIILARETISKVQTKYHSIEYKCISTLFSTLLGYSYRAKYCVIFSQRDISILLHLISQYSNCQSIDDNVDKILVFNGMLSFKTV